MDFVTEKWMVVSEMWTGSLKVLGKAYPVGIFKEKKMELGGRSSGKCG